MPKKRIISMSWGYPDFYSFPKKELASVYRNLAQIDPVKYLQYSPGQGHEGLREKIVSKKLGDFGVITKDEILLAPGGTFSIFLVAFFFKNTMGYKTVGVFHPCFDTTLEIFKIVGLRVVELSTSRKSIVGVDCIYFMSRFSNPAGTNLSSSQKIIVTKLLDKGVLAIEDDVYHTLHYSGEKTPSLKPTYRDQIFYLDSFSKTLAPGFRLGYIVSPRKYIDRLTFLNKFMCSSSSGLSQEIVYRLVSKPGYKKMLAKNRAHYKKKMTILLDALKHEGLDGYFVPPQGGFYVWLRTEKKFNEIIRKKLLQEKTDVVDGDIYFSHSQHGNYIRLSIANVELSKIRKSIKVIKQFLYEK